jgi:ribosomal protein L34
VVSQARRTKGQRILAAGASAEILLLHQTFVPKSHGFLKRLRSRKGEQDLVLPFHFAH